MRYLGIGFSLLLLVGCAAKPITPDRYYRVASPQAVNHQDGALVSLRRVETPGVLGGRSLLASESESPLIVREIRGHLWASPTNVWMTNWLLERGFSQVRLVADDSPMRADQSVTLSLDDLFIDPQQSQVSVGFSGYLKSRDDERALRCRSGAAIADSGSVESAAVAAFASAIETCVQDLDQQIQGGL